MASPQEAPDVDTLFPPKQPDVDQLFPPEVEAARNAHGSVPGVGYVPQSSQEMDDFFDKTKGGRILNAFGQGAKHAWGTEPIGLSQESTDYLKKAGWFNDYAKGQATIGKAANEVMLRPAVAAIDFANRTWQSAFGGLQAAAAQTGEEGGTRDLIPGVLGSPAQLGRTAAALPEAFMGTPHPLGIPKAPISLAEIEKARSLGIIGAGEEGWKRDARAAEPTPDMQAEAAKAEQAAQPAPATGSPSEPSPLSGAPATDTPAAPDIHAVARQIDPATFTQYDALAQRQATFRRWIDELRESRDREAETNAPHVQDIQDTIAKINDPDTTPRLRKKYQARLDAMGDAYDKHMDEATAGDTPDMAKIRQKLQETDYAMRDLAPSVAKAYQTARERFPAEPEAPAAIAEPAGEPAAQPPIEAVPHQETPVPATAAEPAPAEPKPAQQSQPEASPVKSIVDDVTEKLIAAGRPAEEAQAAAQLISSHYAVRAARFKGAKGSGLDLYRAEGPNIVRGRGVKTAAPAAKPEPAVEPPPQVAIAVKQAVPQVAAPPPAAITAAAPIPSSIPNGVEAFAPADLKVDAKRFQFKEGGDEAGVTERLKGVTQWDPIKSGMVLVWKDGNGQGFIVDGHQRHGLASRIAEADPNQKPQLLARVLREADGITDRDARVIAALKNISEGTGTAVDAAKVLRENPERAGELPPRSELYRQAQGLVNLSPEAFGMVINDVVPPSFGAIVGRLVPADAQMQGALLSLLAKTEPANAVQAEAIVRQGIEAGIAKKEAGAQGGLFGDADVAQSLYLERAKVLDKALKEIVQDKKIFSVLTKEQTSIEAAGNKLAADVNQKRAAADAQAIQIIQTLANRKGPISDALGRAAERARQDGRYTGAIGDFVGEVRSLMERHELARLADGIERGAVHVGDENRAGVIDRAAEVEKPAEVDKAEEEAVTLFQRVKKERDLFAEREAEGQMNLPGTERLTEAQIAQRKADEALKPSVAQKPMDEGLFGDSKDQRELFQTAAKTDTPEFKNWFGNSKAIDKDGVPTVAYHGTNLDFSEFKKEAINSRFKYSFGFHFTDNPGEASIYADGLENAATKFNPKSQFSKPVAENANVKPAYLKIENPLEIKTKNVTASMEADLNQGEIIHRLIEARDAGKPYDGVIIEAPDGHRNFIVFEPTQIKSAIGNRGTFDPNNPNILEQTARGKINLSKNARNTITLFKDANASTFLHETGHQWLEELFSDAADKAAPADLIADAGTVRKWLGAEEDRPITRAQHEKFARGFETYMMEGVAPSQKLAAVFAKFKAWLTTIYQTVQRLKSPINDDIRDVFDRMLSTNPQKIVIAGEREAPRSFADQHEALAEKTEPPVARDVAATVQGERDEVAATHAPEHQDARLENVAEGIGRRKAGSAQPDRNGDAAKPDAGESGIAAQHGAIGAGGSEAPQESARPSGEPRSEVASEPQSPHAPFSPDSALVDKAGNIRLDKLNTEEDIKDVIRQTARDNGDFMPVRGPISDAQLLDLADAAGVDAAFIDGRKLGEAWTAPQIVALRNLLIRSATAVRDAMAKAAEGGEAEILAYAEAKARHLVIQERVSSVTAEAGRALRAFQAKFTQGMGDAQSLGDFLKNATGKTLFQLQREAQFGSTLKTPQQLSKFVADSERKGFRDALLEYYLNALISGPITHARYSVGNALNALWTPLIEIPVAAADSAIRNIAGFAERAPKTGEQLKLPTDGSITQRVYLGETGAQIYGMLKGSRDGLRAAIEAFRTGVSPALPGERMPAQFMTPREVIPGPLGAAIRVPGKSVAAIHSFFKSLRYEQNIQALAYRTAMQEGLTGHAFEARVADLTQSPSEAMMGSATKDALKELFMAPVDYHSSMGQLTRAVNNNLLAKIIMPFMKIGTQITRNAFVERTVLGGLSKEVRETLASEQGSAAASMQMAKITTGMALMGTTVLMAAEGIATGDGPNDPDKRRIWLLHNRPNSVQIGNITLPYQGLGHLGMLMRFSANMYETAHAWDGEDGAKLAIAFIEGISKSVLDENFMRGAKDLLDAVYHPGEYGPQFIKNFATNWLPFSVGLSQVARQIDPYQRETHGIFEAAQAKIPWLSEGLFPRRDSFGEPIPNGPPNPAYANDPVVRAMEDLHIGVGKLEKKVRGIQLTPQQYDDYARIAGRDAKMRLNALIRGNPGFRAMPAGMQIELIHNTIQSSREMARDLVMMRNTAIINMAIENKTSKISGKKPQTVQPVH